MKDKEIKDAEDLVNKGREFYDAKNYEGAIKCYEEAIRLDPNNVSAFRHWGNVLSALAEIKRDEALFNISFEKYEKAKELNPNNADTFYSWAIAISDLAKIKQDEVLFNISFEKFEIAARLYKTDSDKADTFCGWGLALYELAKIKQDEALFKEACEKYDKATQLDQSNVLTFYNWGLALYELAKIKQDKSLFESVCEKYEKVTQLDLNNADAFNNCGYALSELAEIKQDEFLFNKSFEQFEKATQLYEIDSDKANAYHCWGYVLFKLAEIKQDESLFNKSFEQFEKATQLYEIDSDKASVFYNWGCVLYELAKIKQDKSLFESVCEKYEKVIQLDLNNADAFNNWGIALCELAKITQDESFQRKLETYEKTFEKIIGSYHFLSKKELYFDTFLVKGALYFVLNKEETEIKNYFIESKKDILEIFTFLDKEYSELIIKTKILHSLLDCKTTKDGKFFAETIGNQSEYQKEKYKDIYIHSIFIISLLHVKNENEKLVAHYREKELSQMLLFNDNTKFRLNAIDYSNDPDEGKTLLDFLYKENKRPSDEKLNNEEYEAFAGCFVLDYDNLNMFRLYGKDKQGKEGTGLSLVFRNNFFSKEAKMALGLPKTYSSKNNDNSTERDKLTLYRCIYIDPNPETDQHIVTVGRKDEYLFYREKKEKKFNDYNNEMKGILRKVRYKMNDLKKIANGKGINPTIVGQLLLNLRYLVKHVAFKEEQECRIVKILRLQEKEIKVRDDYKQIYIEYSPKVSMHIDKIYFGPKAEEIGLFQSIIKNKRLDIECIKSENHLA